VDPDPNPGGPKTSGSDRSGYATLVLSMFSAVFSSTAQQKITGIEEEYRIELGKN
jgi:hypothetical protein